MADSFWPGLRIAERDGPAERHPDERHRPIDVAQEIVQPAVPRAKDGLILIVGTAVPAASD